MHDWLNLASVILLGAYVVLTAFIARFTKRSAEASEKSAKSSDESANAAREATSIQQESVRHGDRAYVALSGHEIVVRPCSNQVPRIRVELRNVGRTPALRGKIGSRMVYWSQELQERNFGDELTLEDFILGPQISHFINLSANLLSDSEMNALNHDQGHLYVWGKVIYVDIFDQEHETYWCLDYSGKIQGFKLVPTLNRMT